MKFQYAGIALCGKSGAGKDTLFKALEEGSFMGGLQFPFVRVAFADQVKLAGQKLTGVDFFDEAVKADPKNRNFLQKLGTDLMRNEWDDQHWVNQGMAAAAQHIEEGRIPVITDARFPNEAEAARKAGFLMVRLEIDEELQAARGRPRTYHASETALDDYEHYRMIIDVRNFSPEDLAEEIFEYMLDDTTVNVATTRVSSE